MVGSSANGVLHATVGGLVWVRRKNGSWWPGQIVCSEELSDTDMVTPRSGTPIKLLGRDDISVDWFDLETTKAVKAFRCGEYDTCIKKASLSAASNSLKFTKYPRRENAIVCALEIEKSMLKDFPDTVTQQNCEKDPAFESEHSSEGTCSEETFCVYGEISHSTQELSQSGISYEETNGSTHIKGLQYRGRKRKTPNDSEDDGYEGIKRMKGLNDLGMVSEKKDPIDPIIALPNPSSENSLYVNNLCGINGVSTGSLSNGSSMSMLKKKRSQVVHLHELLKREYPRRPVTKVLENTTMVPVHIICDEFANPFERSDAVSDGYECEENSSMKSVELSNWLLSEDDSSEILIDVPFVDGDASGFSPSCRSSRGQSGSNIQVQASSFGHEALDEPRLTYFSSGYINTNVEKSASKWQSKGKRNSRHLSNGEKPLSKWKADVHDQLDPYSFDPENSSRLPPSSMASSQRSFPYNQSRFSANSNFELADVSPISIPAESLLYEVEVTVEASRSQAQHVPYISLMSKLNGKPITGHPLAVEVLEDGYCDLEPPDYPPGGSCDFDYEDTEIKVTVKPKSHKKKKNKLRSRFNCRKSSKSKKRRGSGSSSKKTRKLSSLTGAHKSKPMSQTSNGPPTLACIPLKVVFSRINEALNGSRSTHLAANT
ncbi:uncharacterized protein At1g51745 [Silene latifolia]|uniref:uncharacterized protein At1g51745 n=1 Tax=Silene latifolia TaxID=37657 RepID=UPI003D778E9D